MKYLVVGLGNPGKKYEKTRHNVGRITVEHFAKNTLGGDFSYDSISNAQKMKGSSGEHEVLALLPETYMNNSGESVKMYVKTKEEAGHLIVVYDDVDLPLGTLRISFDRGAGGHKGVQSIENHIGTPAFIRLRMGILPRGEEGEIVKPSRDAMNDFVVGGFRPDEQEIVSDMLARGLKAIQAIIETGYDVAMNEYNQA